MNINISTSKIIPVILCGGSGTRLWPMSREGMPKQFLKLLDDHSLLQSTAIRGLDLAGAEASDLVLVTLDSMRHETIEQLCVLNPDMTHHVISEPSARNTAAAVIYAAKYVRDVFGNDAMMWILAADHYIGNESALGDALLHAAQSANEGNLVTFGIQPTRPETGYGYIELDRTHKGDNPHICRVASFTEKPARDVATSYIESGDYLWNSGMFLFRVDAVIHAFAQHASEIMDAVFQSASSHASQFVDAALYNQVDDVPFDTAIMEKASNVAVIPCDPDWSDVGSWEALWELRGKDAHGNVTSGKAICYQANDNIVLSSSRLVTCIGVDNLAVVETSDAIMIMHKSNSDAMKVVVKTLKQEKQPEVFVPNILERQWGEVQLLSRSSTFCAYDIKISAGQTCKISDLIGAIYGAQQTSDFINDSLILIDGQGDFVNEASSTALQINQVIDLNDYLACSLVNPSKRHLNLMYLKRTVDTSVEKTEASLVRKNA
jgi:mannose-1-phosphate guanylyltransferase/mannose-6-phosphate isomerase